MNTTSRRARLLAGVLAGLAAAVPAAQADPPPTDEQMHVAQIGALQNPNDDTVLGFYVTPKQPDGGWAPDGTVLTLATSSCGRPLGTATKTVSAQEGRGGIVDFADRVIPRVGRSIQYRLTITEAGHDPYTLIGSYDGYQVERPSCQEINHPLRPRWSTRQQTKTLVGRTVSVTRTTAPGARITYAWKTLDRFGELRGPVLGTRPSLRLRAAWVGRRVGVAVVVRKPGYLAQSRQLLYSTVRRG
jgi:hypothetical protein